MNQNHSWQRSAFSGLGTRPQKGFARARCRRSRTTRTGVQTKRRRVGSRSRTTAPATTRGLSIDQRDVPGEPEIKSAHRVVRSNVELDEHRTEELSLRHHPAEIVGVPEFQRSAERTALKLKLIARGGDGEFSIETVDVRTCV